MADCQILSVNKACLSARQSVVKVDRSGWVWAAGGPVRPKHLKRGCWWPCKTAINLWSDAGALVCISKTGTLFPGLLVWGMVSCHGSQTANNHSEENSGSDLHQLVGSDWRSIQTMLSEGRKITVTSLWSLQSSFKSERSLNDHGMVTLKGSGGMVFSPIIHCSLGL